MEANEAPEKIYIVNDDLNIKREWYKTKQVGFETTKYTRTDALIEKAEKWLKEHVLEYTPELNFGVGKTDPDYYTKHFIEDFKKYMEE